MHLVSLPFPSPSALLGHLTFVGPENSEEMEREVMGGREGGREEGSKREEDRERGGRCRGRQLEGGVPSGKEYTTKRKEHTAVP